VKLLNKEQKTEGDGNAMMLSGLVCCMEQKTKINEKEIKKLKN